MKTTAARALILVIVVPLIAYGILRYMTRDVLNMPRHYYFDTVFTYEKNGKTIHDTQWHKVNNFKLCNQLGDTISWESMKGKVVILDFFFTTCRSFCPRLSKNMYRLQEAIKQKPELVQLLSFTVDPEEDDVPTIKAYADRYRVRHDLWWLLTGDKKTIYDLAQDEFHVGISEGVKDDFVHTDRFILLDKNRVVRGYYAGQDSTDMVRLLSDATMLSMERTKKH